MHQKFIACHLLSFFMIGASDGAEIMRWDSPQKTYRLKVEAGSDVNASKRGPANAKATLYR